MAKNFDWKARKKPMGMESQVDFNQDFQDILGKSNIGQRQDR